MTLSLRDCVNNCGDPARSFGTKHSVQQQLDGPRGAGATRTGRAGTCCSRTSGAGSGASSAGVLIVYHQPWAQIGQSNTPLWALPLVLGCYATLPVAFLCVGRGLLTGRARLVKLGGARLVGAFVMGVTLFAVFD